MDKVEKIKQLFAALSDREKKEIVEFVTNEARSKDSLKPKGIFTGPVPSSENDFCEKCGRPL